MTLIKIIISSGLILLLFLGCTKLVESFKQELHFYGKTDPQTQESIQFKYEFGVPTPFYMTGLLRSSIESVCTQGIWALYLSEDYHERFLLQGHPNQNDMSCIPINPSDVQSTSSFRHLGPGDTSRNSLTLFSLPGFEGEEIFLAEEGQGLTAEAELNALQVEIEESERVELVGPMSVVSTGNLNWMLFEGINFQGKSICYHGPHGKRAYFNLTEDTLLAFNMTTVGSLISSCDPAIITEYAYQHASRY